MTARVVAAVLVVLLGVLHAQLWFGRGSIPEVQRLRERLAAQRLANEEARAANARLAAEVQDLREGLEIVEEIARSELGMVKPNEILVQFGP
ncbi:septum formation initiator family protein [Tibeticola sp.]|jgi:cell division protein FtsB|uniref:septum formation initiator family protein n=1 Tax=Tibeticola sp. TaxID=2005368 RepID=UPI00258C2234|nr:septum formation initiator family protein [Tibeticola sp.]MCI4440479.1 septum formation initiator family protein [Tibeticola sp.]